MRLGKAEICARIPHAGDMCLLEAADSYDAQRIVCQAISHRDPHNPLRSRGRLHAVCAVEYAGQAIALHGGLLAERPGTPPRTGFLASVRDLKLFDGHLDAVEAPLRIEAVRLAGDADSYIYQFDVSAGGRSVASGRAAVKLMAAEGVQ